MAEEERESFLANFTESPIKSLIGFAVMGGIFGEGIDLTGERLSGVIVIGVGLPQLCMERDLIRSYFDEKNRSGFEFAYQFPGLNRVWQAAGRVIRSETDTGLVVLIDERFSHRRYQELFSQEWRQAIECRNSEELENAVADFWKGIDS